MLKNRQRPDARERPVVITLRVTKSEKARIDEAAYRERKSLNRYCVEALLMAATPAEISTGLEHLLPWNR